MYDLAPNSADRTFGRVFTDSCTDPSSFRSLLPAQPTSGCASMKSTRASTAPGFDNRVIIQKEEIPSCCNVEHSVVRCSVVEVRFVSVGTNLGELRLDHVEAIVVRVIVDDEHFE